MEKIPGWIERLLLPKLNELSGEVKAVHTRIDAVEKEVVGLRREMLTKFESMRNEMLVKFEAVDVKFESADTKVGALNGKVESLRNEMISRFEAVDSKFDSLEARIPVMEKMAEFEVRLAELERKLSTQA